MAPWAHSLLSFLSQHRFCSRSPDDGLVGGGGGGVPAPPPSLAQRVRQSCHTLIREQHGSAHWAGKAEELRGSQAHSRCWWVSHGEQVDLGRCCRRRSG